jgi:hypothetical protein
MEPETIEEQKQEIWAVHGAAARHIETVRVREVIRYAASPYEMVLWDGEVAVYEITGHPKATRCYAWTGKDWHKPKTTTVLEMPPVDSPQAAVRDTLVATLKQARKNRN